MEFFTAANSFRVHPQSILFVTSQLRQREIKMAYALKSLGWIVGLIYYNMTPFKPEGYFDFSWEVKSAHEAYKYAKKLSPRLIHVFSGAIDDYVLLFCRKKIAPVIIDLNDVFTPALMDYCPERYIPTKEALALADGFCARDLQVKYAERLDHCQLPTNILFFPEYCWNNKDKLPVEKSDHEIHIVSVGTISLETYGMFDCCYLELVQRITNHGVHFHLYPPWCYRKDHALKSNANFERDFAHFLELEHKTPYLHIHASLPVAELAKVLRQYDFGIISGGCEEFGQRYSHFKPAYVESCYSGRISDYLDAHLPVLINKEVAFDYWLLKRYGVAFDLKSVMQSNFKSILKVIKQNTGMHKQIEMAANKLSITMNAPRLAAFYSHVMQSTIKTNKNMDYSIFRKITKIMPKLGRFLS